MPYDSFAPQSTLLHMQDLIGKAKVPVHSLQPSIPEDVWIAITPAGAGEVRCVLCTKALEASPTDAGSATPKVCLRSQTCDNPRTPTPMYPCTCMQRQFFFTLGRLALSRAADCRAVALEACLDICICVSLRP